MRHEQWKVVFICVAALIVLACSNREEAVFAAIQTGDIHAVERFVKSGADLNQKNEFGFTALSMAAAHGRTEIVKILVQGGADVRATDVYLSSKNKNNRLSWPNLARTAANCSIIQLYSLRSYLLNMFSPLLFAFDQHNE